MPRILPLFYHWLGQPGCGNGRDRCAGAGKARQGRSTCRSWARTPGRESSALDTCTQPKLSPGILHLDGISSNEDGGGVLTLLEADREHRNRKTRRPVEFGPDARLLRARHAREKEVMV